jgi:hypothetical protein
LDGEFQCIRVTAEQREPEAFLQLATIKLDRRTSTSKLSIMQKGRPLLANVEPSSVCNRIERAPRFCKGAISADQEPFFFFDAMMNILQVWTG